MTEPAFARGSDKAPDAYRTISEVANELGLPQHVLRFWESRFVQIRPLKRGGGRRYYRPDEISLLKGIQHLLYNEGYTIKGVQKVLKTQGVRIVQGLGAGRAMPESDVDDDVEDTAGDVRDNVQPLKFTEAEPEVEEDVEQQLADAYDAPQEMQGGYDIDDVEPSLFDAPKPVTKPPAQLNATKTFNTDKLRAIKAELLAAREELKKIDDFD